jgi:hypothetical protein
VLYSRYKIGVLFSIICSWHLSIFECWFLGTVFFHTYIWSHLQIFSGRMITRWCNNKGCFILNVSSNYYVIYLFGILHHYFSLALWIWWPAVWHLGCTALFILMDWFFPHIHWFSYIWNVQIFFSGKPVLCKAEFSAGYYGHCVHRSLRFKKAAKRAE